MTENKIWTYEEISAPHIKLLKFAALLPYEGKTFNYIGTILLGLYWRFIILMYNIMYLGYGIRMLAQQEFEIDYMCEQFVVENISCRYLLLFYKRDQLTKLMKMCNDIWIHITPSESNIVRSYERKAYYFMSVLIVNAFSIVTSFIVNAQFIRLPPIVENGTELKMLPFRFWTDVQEEPQFTLVSIFQGIVTYSIAVIVSAIEAILLFYVLIACGYLRSVRTRLKSLMIKQDIAYDNRMSEQKKVTEEIYNEILDCVKFHQQIMLFCEEVERCLRGVYLIGIFTTIYNMSMLGLSLMQSKKQMAKYLTILILNVFQFFACQWSPEYLLMESGAISQAAYFASLKQLGRQKQTNYVLRLLIMRSQKPIQLTAGGFQKLSMETFGAMIKSACSFFVVLRTVVI